MAFTHLHLHTEYSLLDGATKISELFPRLKEIGQNAVAITEHGNMGALIKKYKLAKKHDIKLIMGFEPYITEDMNKKEKVRSRDHHLILLAKDLEGYQNLIKLVSIANSDGFYYRPRIDYDTLKKYSKGLICMSACLGNDIAQAYVKGNEDKARELIEFYISVFGKEDFYLEVQNHGIEDEEKVVEFYKRVAPEYGLKIVATTDAHYLKKEDKYAHEVMLCIQTNGDINDPNHFKFDGDGYHVMTEEEVSELFPKNPEYLETTQEIADKCNVELDIGEPIFPNFETPNGISYAEYLHNLCKKGLEKYYGGKDIWDEALERMEFELSVINRMGFAEYFLIVADFIEDAKKHCQVGPGRGSGAGSIVAYILGITQLEPLSLGLLFERFLNPDRISLPDFDVDFGDRDIVLDYVREKYGKDKIAMIGTFGTMSAKSVLKDVMRTFKVPFEDANAITKLVEGKTIQKSLDAVGESGELTVEATELRVQKEKHEKVFEVAQRLEGCVRHKGVHACGVVWGKKPIDEYIPTYYKHGQTITQLEGPDVEDFGLVKFDFLGLETLNVIKKVLDQIGKDGEWLENLPLDDDNVYEMLRAGNSIGAFQIESEGMQKTLKLVQPTCFDDIIAIVALYRPGPMQYIPTYADRKAGRETPKFPDPKAKDILAPTYGIMVYQEQIMQLSRTLANFTAGDSDVLRKAIGKKKLDLMEKMEGQFKDGCINHSGMKEKVVNQLWDDIVKFAEYSFNKSHAAAYALISYRTAYLKKYYPVEFFAATISSSVRDPEKLAFYLEAARQEGIKILHPDINRSKEDFGIEEIINEDGNKEKVIRVGLSGIKNVGGEALKKIIEERPYRNYQDFINKVDISKVNKRVLNNLISVGCFDELDVNRSKLLAVYENVKKEDNRAHKQMTLFGDVANKIEYPDIPDMSLKDMLDVELELLGACVSGHPIDVYKESTMKYFAKYENLVHEQEDEVFGIIKRFTQIITKKGDDMAFMDIVDKTGKLKVTIFPRDFAEIMVGKKIEEGLGVRLRGKFMENEEFGDAFITN
ncbi:MAG: DNA polymerase III subunit alpha, partial [Nitrosarchaeum sp.]